MLDCFERCVLYCFSSESLHITSTSEDKQRSNKVRRRTTQPLELLYGTSNDSQRNEDQNQNHNHPLTRVPSAPGSLK